MKLKQNKQSKLVIALSAVILLLVALSATLTFAYFTATASQTNGSSVNFGKLSISVTPDTAQDSGTLSVDGSHVLVPGCTVTMGDTAKIIVAKDSIDCYVRFKLDITTEKKNAQGSFEVGELTYSVKGVTAESKWKEVKVGGDTYYVYTDKVSAKDAAEELSLSDFQIEVSTGNGNEWMEGRITVKLTAQAIQAEHNGNSAETAFDNYTENGIKA